MKGNFKNNGKFSSSFEVQIRKSNSRKRITRKGTRLIKIGTEKLKRKICLNKERLNIYFLLRFLVLFFIQYLKV